MFELLKELTASRASEKVVVREETRHPIIKYVNSISLTRMEEEKSVGNNEVAEKSVVEPDKSDVVEPLEEVNRIEEVESRTNDGPVKSIEERSTSDKEEELVEVPSSRPVG
nr:hypothetical protein [Tanacetum cinerariifolium]